MSVSEEQETAAQPAIVQALLRAPPAEAQLLLAWARGLGVIRHGELRGGKKMAAMFALTRDHKATWPILKVMSRAVKIIAWDARSWKLRLGVVAVVGTFVAVGNEGAAIVALGGGIGLPLWVLMGAGGVVLGLLADLVKRQLQKPRAA
ncbi:hypothetical protein [uncultured Thiodictyon sp.]|uniref:hypothetical protein n=1 Tax=uncultured Thiodictyon sp. TaxID=1846217 RepID=UPI0025F77736|nr:hypothetical protein [uncultured Thiodictyon sp.]